MAEGLDTLEIPFYYLGLNTVPKRFLFGTLATGAALYIIKPDMFFDEDGTARPWKALTKDAEATSVPWWLVSGAVGLVMCTFI